MTAAPSSLTSDPRLKAVVVALKRNRNQPDSLLEVLHVAQEVYGYLPLEVLWFITRQLRLPPSRVYGVATFYHFFSLKPKGEHSCVVCLGTACYIKGAPQVLQGLERHFGVRAGETTPDGFASVQTTRCVGACGSAPVVIFDGQMAAAQTPESAVSLVQEWPRHGSA